MAISNLDGVLAGFQYPRTFYKATLPTLVVGRPVSLAYLAGIPGAAVAPTPGMSGAALTSYAGQLPFSNPASGNTYLARFVAQGNASGTLYLYDRLWHNSGMSMTSTASQTVNSVTWPARDATGTTDGVQVYIGLEITTATGAGTPTITVTYTNSSGTTGRTATNAVPTVASSPIGTFYPISLAAGDVGVRSVQSIQLSATWTSGAASLVAYRVLAGLDFMNTGSGNALDALTCGFPRMYDNTVPFLFFVPGATTTSTLNGQVVWTQG